MPTCLDLRAECEVFARQQDLQWWPEHSLVASSEESLFTNSFLTPFLPHIAHDTTPGATRLALLQRTFRANQLEYVGRFPLVIPVELLMGFVYFDEPGPDRALRDIIQLLTRHFKLGPGQFYHLISPETGFGDALQRLGVPDDHVITWDKSFPYVIPEAKRAGYYNRIFMAYQGGVLPLCDIGVLIKPGGRLHIDGCVNLERVAFLQSGRADPYALESFTPLTSVLRQVLADPESVHLWAAHARSLFMLMDEGAVPDNRGEGYVIKKMIRQLVAHTLGHGQTPVSFTTLVAPAQRSVHALGYHLTRPDETAALLNTEVQKAVQTLQQAEAWLRRQLRSADTPVDDATLERWKGERGLPALVIRRVLHEHGRLTPELDAALRPATEFFLKNSGYPFAPRPSIDDPAAWLRDAQHAHRATKRIQKSVAHVAQLNA